MGFPWTECMILEHEVIPFVLLSPDERSGVGFEGRVWNLLDVRVAVPVICGASNANPGFRIRHLSGATPPHFKVRVRSEHPFLALAGEVAIEEPLQFLGRQPPWHCRTDQGRRIGWSVGTLAIAVGEGFLDDLLCAQLPPDLGIGVRLACVRRIRQS